MVRFSEEQRRLCRVRLNLVATAAEDRLSFSPSSRAVIPSHVGGRHIPDTAYTACDADVRILQ
jgi:hypothetical protein